MPQFPKVLDRGCDAMRPKRKLFPAADRSRWRKILPGAAMAASAAFFVLAVGGAASLWHDRALNRSIAREMEEQPAVSETSGAAVSPEQTPSAGSTAQRPAAPKGFLDAVQQYPDLRAWLSWEDVLDTPAAQAADNDWYLTHTLDGAESPAGTPFFDTLAAADGTDPVAVVFGHNMKSGEAFGRLKRYSSEQAAQAAPVLTAIFAGGVREYTLFAAFIEDVGQKNYWHYPDTALESREEFLRLAYRRSLYWLADPPETTSILALSTCTGSTGVNSRLVLLLYENPA